MATGGLFPATRLTANPDPLRCESRFHILKYLERCVTMLWGNVPARLERHAIGH